MFVRLSALGAECILQAVALVKSGKAAFTPQNAAEATFCKKIAKEDGLIDFSLPAEEIACRVRAFEPWPCAYTFVRGAQLKIHRAKAAAGKGNPGEVLRADKALEIACGKGSLLVEEVTPQGSRRMSAADYVRGGKIAAGDAVGGC